MDRKRRRQFERRVDKDVFVAVFQVAPGEAPERSLQHLGARPRTACLASPTKGPKRIRRNWIHWLHVLSSSESANIGA